MKNAARTLIATVALSILGVSVPQTATEAAVETVPVTVAPAPVAAPPPPPTPVIETEVEVTEEPQPDAPGIYGATDTHAGEIQAAIDRYNDAGLTLPALRIYVHADTDGCAGHPGIFNLDYSGDRLDLCTTDGFILLHELAHAWEHHTMDDTTRQAFLDHTGLDVWTHADAEWNKRGIEMAANAVAWGLLDTDLTAQDAAGFQEQLHRFEMLTGTDSPRLPHTHTHDHNHDHDHDHDDDIAAH